MMKDQELSQEKCPDCGKQLFYDRGDVGSFTDPPIPDCVYCPSCGFDRPPTDHDYKILGFYDEISDKHS